MTNPRIPFQMSSERPKIQGIEGKQLIVQIIVNVEVWPFDRPMPRKALSTPHGNDPIPDIPNWTWAEYGLRCGMPRLFRLFGERNLPVSVHLNAATIDHYPRLAEAMKAAGWLFIGHGMIQRILPSEEDEAAVITAALEKIEAFTGERPRGWMGPGFAQTFDTPDHLTAAGIQYNLDWVLDDLPAWMITKNGPLLSLPYGFELNDALLFAVERQPAGELMRRFELTLETFAEELHEQPRVLTIALHPHLCAVPHRYAQYRAVIDMLMARRDTVFVTAAQTHDWYRNEVPFAG